MARKHERECVCAEGNRRQFQGLPVIRQNLAGNGFFVSSLLLINTPAKETNVSGHVGGYFDVGLAAGSSSNGVASVQFLPLSISNGHEIILDK
jgi:hypothetical protein